MKKLFFILFSLAVVFGHAAERRISVSGSVHSSVANVSLVGAKVYLLDSSGAVVDSTVAKTVTFYGNVNVELPKFNFSVPYTNGKYTIEATYPDYEPGYGVVDLSSLGSRQNQLELPGILLNKKAKKLGEVTVTASKIKFYNKGDTLVYNADAFELADGSMLDALIRQLPGVELKENGQIFVNGKFVESLMLNGKEFLGNDNQLLLDNLGAYTVKDVAVYDKRSEREKFLGRDMGETTYVMDVRMKKEFLGTYLLNLEAGYGTSERYMGRAFGLRSTATSQISIAGAINNLNDTRRPGQTTTWTPENMVSGVHKEKLFRADYIFMAPDQSWNFSGNTILKHSSAHDDLFTDQMSFLPGGDNYSYIFNSMKSKNLWLGTAMNYRKNFSTVMLVSDLTAQYTDMTDRSNIVSATFNQEQINVTRKTLENIYGGTQGGVDALINRNLQTDSTSNRTFRVFGSIKPMIKIPRTSDALVLGIGADYTHETPVRFNDQSITYGSRPENGSRQTQYFRNSPRHTLKINGSAEYTYWFDGGYFQPKYWPSFQEQIKDSRLYELDHLADLGIFGSLPSQYESGYSDDNSYYGKHREWINDLGFTLAFRLGKVNFQLSPSFKLIHQSLDYTQDNQHIKTDRNSFAFGSSMTHIKYGIGEYRGNWGPEYKHSFDLELKARGITPDMAWLVNIPYTADPLNITVGADRLKNEQTYDLSLTWKYSPQGGRIMESLILKYSNVQNALVRGYRYDSSTGVRTIRSYNVSGNWNAGLSNYFTIPIKSLMLSSTTNLDYGQTVDMIGRDIDPSPYKVKNLFVGEQLSLRYNPFKWFGLTAKTDLQWRRTTSEEPDFRSISALTNNTGVTFLFKLPARFQISTDATMYARRGYGAKELDTTDFVWNARLSWSTANNKWLLMVDGFDILNQLSSVNYSVNRQGRTIVYTNTLPRYLMFHFQYKINILPKKK